MNKLRAYLSPWRVIAVGICGLGLYAAIIRFSKGLGAATNLVDAFPWGLWIGFDVLVGVGLAAGGFTIAAAVHVFHLDTYKPIARPAVFTAFIGYLLVILGLLFDLGQPWDIWHPLVMWNPRSVMFEVAWCMMLYTAVLALEFSPVVLDRLGLRVPQRIIRAVYVPLVITGVLLSMLHQSSLGTLYVIVPDKLHGLWYTPLLPVFFFLTALAAGLAMTIIESYLSHRAFARELEHHLLEGLGRVIVVVLGVYAVWKLQDLAGRGQLGLLALWTPESVMFWGEMGLGVLLPLVMLSVPRLRASRESLVLAALFTVLGFITNRMNVAITGMSRSSGVTYFPSLEELAITASLIVLGFTAFRAAAKHLALFPTEGTSASIPREAGRSATTISGWAVVGLWALLGVGAALYMGAEPRAETQKSPQPSIVAAAHAAPPSELRLPAAFSFPRGADSRGTVTFDHDSHVDAERPRCGRCHDEQFQLTAPGTPVSGKLTMKRIRDGELCGSCHDGTQAFGVEDECESCHTP